MAIPRTSSRNKSLPNFEYIKFKILITVLILGYIRALYFVAIYNQTQKSIHLIISILGFTALTGLLLYAFKYPKKLNILLHGGILLTFMGMIYRIFFVEQYIITQIQSSFLIVIWAFYGLGYRWGIFYAIIFTIVFPVHTITNGYVNNLFPNKEDDTYYITWTLFILNMMVMIYVPYLYQSAIRAVINRKIYLNKSLKDSIEANKDFTSIITHELKTPLNSVIGITNLLREKNNNVEESKDLDKLHKKATYLLSLINKILEYNKLNINLIKKDINKLDLIQFINKTLDSNRVEIELKSHQIIKNFNAELSNKLIITEVNRFSIAIKNLLEYFIRISPLESKITLNIDIQESIDENHKILVISIENSLINNTEQSKQHFFEPFIITDNQNNDYTGLELSIAKKAIEQLNSNIEFYNSSKPGINLQFKTPITLENKTIDEEKNTINEKEIDISKINIIIVDDNAINLLFMKSLLSHWNISAKTISNGYDAISQVQKEHIDIILMDIHMPEISGFETSRKIRELINYVSQPYIIAVSAVNKEDIENELNKYGINDFLPKPINQNDLKKKLVEYYIKEI